MEIYCEPEPGELSQLGAHRVVLKTCSYAFNVGVYSVLTAGYRQGGRVAIVGGEGKEADTSSLSQSAAITRIIGPVDRNALIIPFIMMLQCSVDCSLLLPYFGAPSNPRTIQSRLKYSVSRSFPRKLQRRAPVKPGKLFDYQGTLLDSMDPRYSRIAIPLAPELKQQTNDLPSTQQLFL